MPSARPVNSLNIPSLGSDIVVVVVVGIVDRV